MLKMMEGNILRSNAQALVNTVNCAGVMGKGIALQFKKAFPENFKLYKDACQKNAVVPGKMFITQIDNLPEIKYIVNFPTKKHWKEKSRISYIEDGLDDLFFQIQKLGIKSVAIPPLGCGLGGLKWDQVSSLIHNKFADAADLSVYLYKPSGAPRPKSMPLDKEKSVKMTRARAVYLQMMKAYKGVDYSLGMLEIQKLAYFVQESGEDLKLRFVKDRFGPYAENLHHTLQNIEGPMITGYGDRCVTSEIQPLPQALKEAEEFLKDKHDAIEHLKKVIRLIRGFETPYGLELLSSVHWAAKDSPKARDDFQVIKRYVSNWNDRKKRNMPEQHLQVAWKKLRDLKWI
jgi:O-acetyl-ADP-ribose deacetylase (regulator of RNase III)